MKNKIALMMRIMQAQQKPNPTPSDGTPPVEGEEVPEVDLE